jgi:TPR repeat protein
VGVPKDEVESVRWHTKAADNGNAASQLSLGMFYMSGNGVPKNEAEGVKWLRKSAEQGNADGEFWLGAAYYAGTGVAKDNAEALRWYRKAGDQGNAAAQYNLGQAYNLGNGVEKDTAEAARWWQKAAEQGLAKAQYNLGLAYHDGIGVQEGQRTSLFLDSDCCDIPRTGICEGSSRQSRSAAHSRSACRCAGTHSQVGGGTSGDADRFIKFLTKRPTGSSTGPPAGPTTGSHTRRSEAGIFDNELHIEIRVSDSIGVQGGTPELEEIRTGFRLERQGKDGCRDYGANDLR